MLTELRDRSQKANEIIEKLKHQIEQIKLQTTPVYMAKRVGELKGENEKLKKRVDELKKELEEAEAGKSVAPTASQISWRFFSSSSPSSSAKICSHTIFPNFEQKYKL